MMQKYSITEQNQLLMLIHQIEKNNAPIELTKSGKSIAVLISKREYDDLTQPNLSVWETLMAFREQEELEQLNIDPEMFNERKRQEYGPKFDF